MGTHLKLCATQLKQLIQNQKQSLHDLNIYSDLPWNMKVKFFHNSYHTNIIFSEPDITPKECKKTSSTLNYHQHTIPQYSAKVTREECREKINPKQYV